MDSIKNVGSILVEYVFTCILQDKNFLCPQTLDELIELLKLGLELDNDLLEDQNDS